MGGNTSKLTKEINTDYLYLFNIIKEVTDEYILEPSVKYSNNECNHNRYSVLLPYYEDFLVVLFSILKNDIITPEIYSFIIDGMKYNADGILGIDNDKLKIYMDYGYKIEALVLKNNKVISKKSYIVLDKDNEGIALRYAYLFKRIGLEIDVKNWRHVYRIKNKEDEYHISLIKPVRHANYVIYIIGITSNSITIYHR